MKRLINYYLEEKNYSPRSYIDFFSAEVQERVRDYHRSFPQYRPSPLHSLEALSSFLGLDSVYLKDESERLSLNAFKVLGVSYALAKILAQRLGQEPQGLSFEYFSSEEVRRKLGEIVFVTATDGNHGRALAWAASRLGQKSVVYMPRGSSDFRLEAIINEGSQASIIDGNYDDAVRLSREMAEKEGWIVVQDTSWPGYEEIPLWIMQGYTTIISEVFEEVKNKKISHVFLQAGVGSFAGAMLGALVALKKEDYPTSLIIEPAEADCFYRSALKGRISPVGGDMPTIMAGLACGEPNSFAYEIIRDYAGGYFSCDDELAALGMRILAAPLKGDPPIVAGESGALGIGVLYRLMKDDAYRELREELKLNSDSKVLIISTEADTDPHSYREIVWGLD